MVHKPMAVGGERLTAHSVLEHAHIFAPDYVDPLEHCCLNDPHVILAILHPFPIVSFKLRHYHFASAEFFAQYMQRTAIPIHRIYHYNSAASPLDPTFNDS